MLKLGQNYDLLCNMIIRPPRFVYGIFIIVVPVCGGIYL